MEDDVIAEVQVETEAYASSIDEDLLAGTPKGDSITDGTSNT
jgi:hypothetical protein